MKEYLVITYIHDPDGNTIGEQKFTIPQETVNEIKADERSKTIEEMAKIITELNNDTTICNSFNCPRADEPITCTMCILERAIKQMKKEQK